ncbi:MAG: transglycosylase SLT domain-containing protein [Chitinivibrionia bacterium]|nr:transglycosylase SLT domain-containing protein [Chitinivibrionia bacterium]
MKKLYFTVLLFLIFYISAFGQRERVSVRMIDSLMQMYSVAHILEGDFEKAERQIRSIEYSDSGLFFLALGEIDLRRGNRNGALLNFIVASENSERVAPFAFRRIGDMELAAGNWTYAVSAFRIAAQRTTFQSYRSYLQARVDSIKNAFPDDLDSIIWGVLFWDEEQDGEFEESAIMVIQRRLRDETLTVALFNELLELAKERNIERTFYSRIADTSLADRRFDALTAFNIAAQMAEFNQNNAANNWLHFSMNRPNFASTVPQQRFLRQITRINFALQNWNNVIKFGGQYITRFGETVEVMYDVGRAHRRTNNNRRAQQYYDRIIARSPNSRIAHDILWWMAWNQQDNRQFERSRATFQRIANQQPLGRRGEEAVYRMGLINFRQKRYDAALQDFATFQRRFPVSRWTPAVLFWTARSHLALGDTTAAMRAVETINRQFPLTYHDFRSRELSGVPLTSEDIITIDDATWIARIDALPLPEATTATPEELDNLLLGIFLGNLGFKEEALLLFQPIEDRNQRNFPIVLALSRFYTQIGAYHRSYRLIRRLHWALPQEQRRQFSPEYAALFYPRAWLTQVDTSSARFDVDPDLVWAVMRQESMFSETILSPVGAMGLMQIMPATGRQIARELRISPFEPRNLLTPDLNVHFGAYYLGRRLRQFNGNQIYALASYNGGSHNVQRWIRANQDVIADQPYFTEVIGFFETRQYVQIVLENYWIYRLIQR